MADKKKRQVSPMDGEPTTIHVEEGPAQSPDKKPAHQLPLVFCIVIGVVCLALGLVIGRFLLGGVGGAVSGKTTLSEGELDATVATYTYEGSSHDVTAREVFETGSGLESARKDDGTYAFPAASDVLAYAQNQILNQAVEAAGITVSDEDMTTYAQDTLGSSDFKSLASTYGMSEDAVKTVVRQSAGVKKLYDQVVGSDASAGTMPESPATPASEDEYDTKNATYGEYIVNLLGDEWDKNANTWARKDGPYYAAMSDMDFTSDSASYNQAMTAYYVAYQQYSQVAGTASSKWTTYVNGLFAKASINIGEMVS
ncbi:hypothetical protein QJ043_04920 [Olsenella sp. YH-ols2217]|uniref:SurA-like protein n=1 Tax=Kribbibacterium absianum TaxID=3044210 RepID=A0ABT6ZK60_9ACTN|nr:MULTISPECIES: hypothetical protein [unclassified Olsenella]MDJ1122913.1 hypothetical protein [Olsenella sp. YH-ols2216]MDJ1129420.1 hypothetical protein [Olsenella sp. YH-ols2217]